MNGTQPRMKWVTLVKFSSTSAACALGAHVEESRPKPPPALLTRMSTAPRPASTSVSHCATAVGVAHVEHAGQCPTAGRLDRGRGGGEAVLVAVAHGHVGAVGREGEAIAAPMPCAAPVTIAVRPVSEGVEGSTGTIPILRARLTLRQIAA